MSRIPTAPRLLVLAACLLLPTAALAQSSRDKVQFRGVRVGFPAGPTVEDPNEINTIGARDSLYKSAAWTPVYIGLTNINKYDPKKDGPAEVIVETPDCDDTAHTYTVPVPPFDEKEGLARQADAVA